MKRTLVHVLFGAVLVFAAGSLPGAVHYVDLNSTNATPPYTNWSTAAQTIQDAIDAAQDGDMVLVTNGVYDTGGRVAYGTLTNRVAITRPLTVQSVNGPGVTLIRGLTGFGISFAGAVRSVYLTNGAVIAGFTITNGGTSGSSIYLPISERNGGGVWSDGPCGLVTNCVIVGNAAGYGGGASGGVLRNCMLSRNLAGEGGAAFGAALFNCTLGTNQAYYWGGGAESSALVNCTVVHNDARFGGAGAYKSGLTNCVLSGNYGGGVYLSTLDNCTICSNTAGGGGFASVLNNCIVYYNSYDTAEYPFIREGDWDTNSTLSFCCTRPLPALGSGNITNEPLFVDQLGGNLRLQSNSPCINAGNNAYALVGLDLDGLPRIAGGTVDIGAYEFQNPASQISYAWLQNFGLPIDGSADFIDPDGDGVDNWHEWLAGTDPTDPLSSPAKLNITSSGTNLILTWPTNAVGFRLESATNLCPAIAWRTNSPATVVMGEENVQTNAVTGPQQFFRLHKD